MTTGTVVGLSLVLFVLGVIAFFVKRDLLTQFMAVEIMLNAANLAFLGLAQGAERARRPSDCLPGHDRGRSRSGCRLGDHSPGFPPEKIDRVRRLQDAEGMRMPAFCLHPLRSRRGSPGSCFFSAGASAANWFRSSPPAPSPCPWPCRVAAFLASFRGTAGTGVIDPPIFTWISAGAFQVEAALRFDALTAVMTLVVSGVGLLIHIYSVGYMARDRDLAAISPA